VSFYLGCSEVFCAFKEVLARYSILCIVCVLCVYLFFPNALQTFLYYCSEVLCAFKEVFARCSMLCIVCVVVVPERPSDFPLLLLCLVSERLSAHP
jgi:hypothetical protein